MKCEVGAAVPDRAAVTASEAHRVVAGGGHQGEGDGRTGPNSSPIRGDGTAAASGGKIGVTCTAPSGTKAPASRTPAVAPPTSPP